MSEPRWVPVAEIARPHGVAGEVRLKLYNSESELLLDQEEILLRHPSGRSWSAEVQGIRGAQPGLILKLQGIDDRDQAEALRGVELCVDRARFPPLEDGEFYFCDVIGAKLVGPTGELGVVEDIASYPSTEAIVARLSASNTRVEIPMTELFVERVDVGRGEILLRPEALELLS